MSLRKKERAVLKAALVWANSDCDDQSTEMTLLETIAELGAELGLGNNGPKNNAWYYTDPNDEPTEKG